MAAVTEDKTLKALKLSKIKSDSSELVISNFGAQALCWTKDKKEILFSNSKRITDKSKAIRGGAPICFPWFNKGLSFGRELKPSHGTARISDWEKVEGEELSFVHTTTSHLDLPIQIEVSYLLSDANLQIIFCVKNLSVDKSNKFELALHTYFATSDPGAAKIFGLINEQEAFSPEIPIDRIFTNSSNNLKLVLPDLEVKIENKNFPKSVVWHPGLKHGLPDLEESDNFAPFICFESFSGIVVLAPEAIWRASVTYYPL